HLHQIGPDGGAVRRDRRRASSAAHAWDHAPAVIHEGDPRALVNAPDVLGWIEQPHPKLSAAKTSASPLVSDQPQPKLKPPSPSPPPSVPPVLPPASRRRRS